MSPSNDTQLIFVVKLQVRATVPPPLMAKLASHYPKSHHQKRHGLVFEMAQEISKRGIPVCTHLFTMSPIGEDVNYNKSWNFDLRDHTRDRHGNDVFDFDLRSRVLTFNDADYTSLAHVAGALEEVENVVQVLNECEVPFSVSPIPADHRATNLHVYVGLKKKKSGTILGSGGGSARESFELEALKALCGVVTATEPCISSMLHKNRSYSDHHKTPSMTFRFAGKEVWKRITMISNVDSVGELVDLMNPDNPRNGKNYAYNFAHLLRHTRDKKRDGEFSRGMIEFRQHEASLDQKEVINWLQCVAGLVRLALKEDTLSRTKNWAVSAEAGAFTFQNLLMKIGKPHLIDFYGNKPNRPYSMSYVTADGIREPQPYKDSARFSPEPDTPITPVDDSIKGRITRVLSCGRGGGSGQRSKDVKDPKTGTTKGGSSTKGTKEQTGPRREKSAKDGRRR